MPVISIIMPTYNVSGFLADTLDEYLRSNI